MSTHNLCFGTKIRKIDIPLHTQVYYIKVGFKGVYISWTCFPEVMLQFSMNRDVQAIFFFFHKEMNNAIKNGTYVVDNFKALRAFWFL